MLILALLATSGQAETIILKGERRVVGDVLKSDEEFVIVDLGCAVLRLPRAQVVSIDDASPATKPTAASRPADEEGQGDWQLYRTTALTPTTIEANAQRFGEAVVMVTSPAGQGSGFVITPDGYCVTNYHVIARETRIKVTVFRRTEVGYEQKHYKQVKIVALNPFVDLALLKIQAEGETFKYAYLGQTTELKVGQDVFAIGNPLGLTRTVSQGIVSTTNRNFEGQLYVQTTTAINPGNSGGPLFNLKGEVIGVTSMGYLFLGGLNFAIPVDVVKRFIMNRDAFAYDEDNPNSGYRYLQPAGRTDITAPPKGRIPRI
ncbi:MAG: trypsin-like peptidase domain-containing protein [Planctomycetes bacterium]|nr:trypsin-like peptidase domain-containing protein [Planctomycetota bacterium]